ncbi:hypothetical protein J0S82_011796, partial [Galemys pyrenaicus]
LKHKFTIQKSDSPIGRTLRKLDQIFIEDRLTNCFTEFHCIFEGNINNQVFSNVFIVLFLKKTDKYWMV